MTCVQKKEAPRWHVWLRVKNTLTTQNAAFSKHPTTTYEQNLDSPIRCGLPVLKLFIIANVQRLQNNQARMSHRLIHVCLLQQGFSFTKARLSPLPNTRLDCVSIDTIKRPRIRLWACPSKKELVAFHGWLEEEVPMILKTSGYTLSTYFSSRA